MEIIFRLLSLVKEGGDAGRFDGSRNVQHLVTPPWRYFRSDRRIVFVRIETPTLARTIF